MADKDIRVMVADDSGFMRKSISDLVTSAGFEVVATAKDGKDAIVKAISSKSQIALLDINMPGTDGIYALEKLTALFPDIVAIMMTSDSNPKIVDRCMDIGAAGYILKDDGKEEIIETIEDCWDSNSPE